MRTEVYYITRFRPNCTHFPKYVYPEHKVINHRYIEYVDIIQIHFSLVMLLFFYSCTYYYVVTTIESSCFVNAQFYFLLRQRY